MAVHAAGALGVLDVGRDAAEAARALATLAASLSGFGVRIPEGVALTTLPAEATTVIVTSAAEVARWPERRVLVQVTSADEALAAVAAGASGVIAKGAEAGGRVGDETTFVLLQHLAGLPLPVWAQGGIGLHTAAACVAGGAAGVVLDTQLALVRESSLPLAVRAAIGAMDGSETTLVGGQRVFTRPDLPVAKLGALDASAVRARLGGDDLAADLLPLGQDGAFARPLAQRFASAGQLVHGVAAAIDAQLASAARLQPLAPGAPFAAAHGLTYPIAQGPMSRVSDRARFAEAVAQAGGLPFLALSLMSGEEVRELLRETRARLGELPWGVGILGFVPPEVREQQLAVMREIAPPIALIAGGRPSQAQPLEAQGTATYLHVPSPGLLDMFLRDGARRFVFEGSECGGHVGPRSSFALWEAQIARLMAHPAPAELSLLFAGGIHDARSAAMVAAMAAPLAERGARIGVLMGTAYLFTHEAVSAGAIAPGFQEAAIGCERTVLLETSPGHATRCVDSAYAADFAEEKRRLEAAGVGSKEMWAQLEQMNLGRLRIAAKGKKREGGAIVDVDAATQLREGMYMIGQVAALRRETCSIAELHHQVSAGGDALLRAVAQACVSVVAPSEVEVDQRPGGLSNDVDRRTGGLPTDVALIGLAAMYPGAPDTEAFWRNVVTGANAIREVPPDRWDIATFYDPAAVGADAGKKTPCKWGGFLDDIPFDPIAYGIPPKSLQAIEPVQLLALEVARRALGDAGYGERAFDRERTSVIFGAEAGTDLSSAYSFRALFPHYVGPLPEGLDAALPKLSEDSFPGVLSNVIAGRIANRLDLGGVNYTVDAACAASLAALDMAVKELVAGSSDMVLCGGADLHNSINDYLMFASVHALSPTGQCHTFDADADGIVLGEGVACVVLKRLADAERDGDRIYAVIKGVAGASDGKSLGLTAPRKEGQVRALERAYRQAGISPAEVGLVEAHGTGTVVGDRTELATLTEVYARAGSAPGACVLGSVKSQIGHTKCAAGMAGLIKTALAIHHGVLPPTLNIKRPNPAWQRASSPFVFLDAARPWPASRRIAAVSAFGFGGTNFHAVLASPPARRARENEARAQRTWPAELLLFRGADRAAALALLERVARSLDAEPRLRDVARTVAASGSGPVQIAIVADGLGDLRAKIALAQGGRGDKRNVWLAGELAEVSGKIAFLCPGQGSQRPGMLAELFVAFPELHRWLELGAKWRTRMLPPAAFTREERAAQVEALTDTRVAQPALGVADLAVADLLGRLGVRPDMAAGHSYGELAALALAGALAPADLLALSEARGEAILAEVKGDAGAMAAVAADATVVAPLVAGCEGVVIANHNSPSQCVLSGPTAAIETAVARVAAAGHTVKALQVACAFHSPIVAGAREALARKLATLPVAAPSLPVWSNATAEPYPLNSAGVRALLAEQVARPVLFAQQIEAMYAAGARIFVESGPGQVLTRLTGEILGARPHLAVACDVGDAGLRQLLRALAALAVAGVPLDVAAFFSGRDADLIDLDASTPRRPPAWLVNGHGTRPASSPRVPAKPVVTSMTITPSPALAHSPAAVHAPAHSPAAAPALAGREDVLLEYLRNMRSLISAQRDVMLSYLGSTPAPMLEMTPARRADWVVAPAAASSGYATAYAATPAVAAAPAPVAPVAPVAIDPLQLVLSIVSERTGYPAETLGLDLDLEADLSIDSIKRIEIIGELAHRLGLRVEEASSDADSVIEELAARKTLRALVEWLSARLALLAQAPAAAASRPDRDEDLGDADLPLTTPVGRYRLATVAAPLPLNGRTTYAGRLFAICEGGAAADDLTRRLEAEGARVRRVARDETIGEVDGYIDLARVESVEAMRAMFERVRAAALGGATRILVGTFGGEGGPAGLIKTLAAEWPNIVARVVHLARAAEPGALLHDELHAADPHVEIVYADGVRSTLDVVPAELSEPGGEASEPDTVEVEELPLGAESVVLVTGGACGITAKIAVALAQRYGCRIELVGRSPLPGPEEPALASAADARGLRAILARRGMPPAEVERQCARILKDREIRATLATLGESATYHPIDVRTPAFATLIDALYDRHGRIDGVIHGAGVLEDKLMREKSGESFERVFATKLVGARTLLERLRPDVGFVVLFSSISGTFGNRGQADYAAAGDALDKLASAMQERLTGRVVAIDWGPWAGVGMVSPELEREYARRNVALIHPERGVEALLAELRGGRGETQVILTASDPRALLRRSVTTAGG